MLNLEFLFMKKSFCLLSILYLCSFSMVLGQKKYTEQELVSFYKIYSHTINHPFETLQVMHSLLGKVNISEERMTEIMTADAMGKTIAISEQEKNSLEEMKKLLQKEKDKYDAEIEAMMKKEKLSPKKYQEIKAAFLKDPQLRQKTLKIVEKKNSSQSKN